MGWKEFAASVIASTAWPFVLLLVVLILLGPIRGLIGRIRTWKAFGVEAELAENLQTNRRWLREAVKEVAGTATAHTGISGSVELATDVPKSPEPAQEPEKRRAEDEDQASLNRAIYELAAGLSGDEWETRFARPSLGLFPSVERTIAAPVVGIRESWDVLGAYIAEAAKNRRDNPTGTRSMPKLLGELQRAGLIGDSFVHAVLGLWKIRNEVINGEVSPGPQEAIEYRQSARSLHLLAQKLLTEDEGTAR